MLDMTLLISWSSEVELEPLENPFPELEPREPDDNPIPDNEPVEPDGNPLPEEEPLDPE